MYNFRIHPFSIKKIFWKAYDLGLIWKIRWGENLSRNSRSSIAHSFRYIYFLLLTFKLGQGHGWIFLLLNFRSNSSTVFNSQVLPKFTRTFLRTDKFDREIMSFWPWPCMQGTFFLLFCLKKIQSMKPRKYWANFLNKNKIVNFLRDTLWPWPSSQGHDKFSQHNTAHSSPSYITIAKFLEQVTKSPNLTFLDFDLDLFLKGHLSR